MWKKVFMLESEHLILEFCDSITMMGRSNTMTLKWSDCLFVCLLVQTSCWTVTTRGRLANVPNVRLWWQTPTRMAILVIAMATSPPQFDHVWVWEVWLVRFSDDITSGRVFLSLSHKSGGCSFPVQLNFMQISSCDSQSGPSCNQAASELNI